MVECRLQQGRTAEMLPLPAMDVRDALGRQLQQRVGLHAVSVIKKKIKLHHCQKNISS